MELSLPLLDHRVSSLTFAKMGRKTWTNNERSLSLRTLLQALLLPGISRDKMVRVLVVEMMDGYSNHLHGCQ